MRFVLVLAFSIAACTKPSAPGEGTTAAERAPAEAGPPAAAPPGKITIGVNKSPPGTLVMESATGRILGRAPGPIEIERSIDPLKLEFLNPDFVPEHRVVTPSQDLTLSVPMRPLPRRRGPPPPPEQR